MSARDQYEVYRSTDQSLMNKVMLRSLRKSVLNRAGQMLGIAESDVFSGNPQARLSVLFDFALHDVLSRGKSAIEHYRDDVGGESELERELLNAHAIARTSLYQVIEKHPTDNVVVLRDLLQPEVDVQLTDVNLGRSAVPGMLLFLRGVVTDALTFTSGMTLGFPATNELSLLNDFQARSAKVDLLHDARRRFVHFFKEYQAYGLETRYQQAGE